MIWNVSREEHCDTCDDLGLAEVRGIEVVDFTVYDVGCAPCPDCERGRRRVQYDASGIVDDEQQKPPDHWKQRRWPQRQPDEFIRSDADHTAQGELAFKTATRLVGERQRTDAENFLGAEPPPP